MAKGQREGFGSLTVWMILFVALWLTSTVLLVILYTNQEGYLNQISRLQDDNQRLIRPGERNAVALFEQALPSGPSVVGLLEDARAETALLATGDDADDAAAVRAKLDDLLRTIQSERVDNDKRQAVQRIYHREFGRICFHHRHPE